jgi:hypothetical protein
LAYLAIYDIPSLPVTFRAGYPFVVGEPADFDTFSTQTLNGFDYVVATRSAYASVPPANWHPVAATRFYQVWRRTGFTAPYVVPSGVGSAPGQLVTCSTSADEALTRTRGTALVTAPPIVLDGSDWQGAEVAHLPGASAVAAGMAVSQRITLPPGRWQMSLQYTSSTSLMVHTLGLSSELPAALEHQGPYWPVGDVTSTGSPLSVSVAVHVPPPLATGRSALIGDVAFVRVDVPPRKVPLRAACGDYVDWYVN